MCGACCLQFNIRPMAAHEGRKERAADSNGHRSHRGPVLFKGDLGYCCHQHSCRGIQESRRGCQILLWLFPPHRGSKGFCSGIGEKGFYSSQWVLPWCNRWLFRVVTFVTGQPCLPERKKICILGCQQQRFHWIFYQEGPWQPEHCSS